MENLPGLSRKRSSTVALREERKPNKTQKSVGGETKNVMGKQKKHYPQPKTNGCQWKEALGSYNMPGRE
jgi:hypothetical protein